MPDAVGRRSRTLLDPDALTIGFARRFATYKRADLILSDLDRLAELVNDTDRPCSSSSPARPTRPTSRARRSCSRSPTCGTTAVSPAGSCSSKTTTSTSARHLVQGVDVWLNNPRRPLEASGTSGRRSCSTAASTSILDGWWAEAYDGNNGFAIGNGRTHVIRTINDERDADELCPACSERGDPAVLRARRRRPAAAWIKRMKSAISTLAWRFNADRMVMDYVRRAVRSRRRRPELRDGRGARTGGRDQETGVRGQAAETVSCCLPPESCPHSSAGGPADVSTASLHLTA